jgi:hypothetical protein
MNILPDCQLSLIPVHDQLVLQYLREHEREWRNLAGYHHCLEFGAWKLAYEKLKPHLVSRNT